MNLIHPKEGWLSYLVAGCFVVIALYYVCTGDAASALQSLAAAIGTAGLKSVVKPEDGDGDRPTGPSRFLLLGLLLLSPAPVSAQTVCDCTVQVAVPGRGGSGVVIGRNGDLYLATTADHVTTGYQQASLSWRGGRTGQAQVCGSNRQTDVALLCFRCTDNLPYCGLGDDPKQGDPIWQCGYPAGRFSTTAGYARGTEAGKFTANLHIESGDSGGGFFDSQGRLVAISTVSMQPCDPFTRRPIGASYAGGPSASLVLAEIQRSGCGVGAWVGISGCPGGTCNPYQGGGGGGTYKQPAPQMPSLQPPSPPPAPSLDQQALRDLVRSAVAESIRTLPPGPPGPIGPVGPQGVAGPAGPAGKEADPSKLSVLDGRIGALEARIPAPVTPGPTRIRIEPVPNK